MSTVGVEGQEGGSGRTLADPGQPEAVDQVDQLLHQEEAVPCEAVHLLGMVTVPHEAVHLLGMVAPGQPACVPHNFVHLVWYRQWQVQVLLATAKLYLTESELCLQAWQQTWFQLKRS